MQQSQTQKNWNEFYGNKQPGTRPPVLIIIFILALLSAGAWYLYNGNLSKIETSSQDDTEQDTEEKETKSVYKTTVGFAYNKNGSTMSESISRLDEIMHLIATYQEDETLKEYIEKIEELDLSDEYTPLKKACIKKIEYMRKFIEDPDEKYLKKYNEIDYIEELAKAFDLANVRYKLQDDGGIKWWYSPSPDYTKN